MLINSNFKITANLPVRLNLGIMIFVLSFLNYMMSVNLSIGIIAMTEIKNISVFEAIIEEAPVVSILFTS